MIDLKQIAVRAAGFGAQFRNPAVSIAFDDAIGNQPDGAICVSVGGGPLDSHPRLINLNIRVCPNVHVSGDAHLLPMADCSLDAVYSEAVIEHLRDPSRAVSEMYRVLKPGGRLLTIVPFLQVFHGYPDHFQNLTLSGHRLLIDRAGFTIIDLGTCVGPVFAVLDIVSNFLRECFPSGVAGRLAYYGIRMIGAPFCMFDKMLTRHASSHVLASTTFVLAEKPAINSEYPRGESTAA
jgi:SAM-dependent methyltransferase